MRIQDKEELRQKRDSLNDLIEELENMKSKWYDSGVSPEDMKSIRKMIRKVILQRDKCDDKLQSVTKLVDRSGVNGNNPPFPPFQCCKIKNFVLFHVILGCNALSIVFQQIYATLKRGRGVSFIKLHNYLR